MASATGNKHADSHKYLRNAPEPDRSGNSSVGEKNEPLEPFEPGESVPLARRYGQLKSISDPIAATTRQWKNFCVLAVRIDLPRGAKMNDGLTAELDALFQKAEKQYRAAWFHWQDALYGCAVPETAPPAALEIAEWLQAELARKRPETITIGLARFPQIGFNRSQVFINAYKALDHAAFFGPGGKALFDSVTLNISGDLFYQEDDLQGAIAEYRDALHLDAKNPNVHNSMGVCLAKKNDLEAARKSFQTAIENDPKDAMAAYNLGVIHMQKNEIQEALACFEKAYSLDTGTFEIAFQIGKLHTEKGRWEQGRCYLESAIALRDDSSAAFSLLGQCLAAEEKETEAIKAYKKAVKLNPNDPAALSALGDLYAAKDENPDICLTFSRQSVSLSPQNGLFRHRLACLYQKFAQYDKALAEFEKASALGYDSSTQIEQLRRQVDAADGLDETQRCA